MKTLAEDAKTVERVARAISKAVGMPEKNWSFSVGPARAAIRALSLDALPAAPASEARAAALEEAAKVAETVGVLDAYVPGYGDGPHVTIYNAKIADAIRALASSPAPASEDAAERVRHKKRGSTYRVIGEAELQTSEHLPEGETLVVYRCEQDGKLWARPDWEFRDGRFEPAPPQQQEQGGENG